jgi:NDP-sugar pyrophosphorylase family protein
MNEKKKAEALSQSLDALSRGEESASSISADEEIRALSELGYSLHNIEFEPSPAHQAAVERLLQKHRVDCERSAVTGTSDPNGLTAREVNGKTPATKARFLPKRLIPLAALSGGVALLLICALVVLIGGGVAWRAFRDTDSVFVSEATISHDVSPSPSSTSETSVAQGPSPSPSPTSERSLAQNPTPDLEAELSYTVFLPAVVNPLPPQSARLKDIRGVVEIRADGDTWTLVREGRVIKAGQRVRTGALSSASLAFYDGSTAYLGPNTEVSVDHLDQDPTDGSRIVELTQWVGQTDHDVASAYGDHARYEVHTPSGTGEAKGTRFHVLVTPALVVRFNVDQGAVAVTNLNVTVVVVAGQLTVIEADQSPSQPVFRVTGEGEVTQTGTTWTIAGQDFETHDGTVIIGNPQVGDWVSVAGHLLADGTRVADRIALLRRSPVNRFTIIGEVEAIEDTAWTVAGQTITVNEETAIEEGVEIGDVVRVEGVLLEDGTLLAERIRLVEEEPGLPFHFVGVLQGIDDEAWAISGISITVNADTELDEDLVVGDVVEVRGWILEDDNWLARSIKRLEEQERRFEFTGYVDSIDPWVVSGIAFETRDWTEIETGIEVGDAVKVEGRILEDGTWVAVEIKRLDDEEALYFEFVGTVDSTDPWAVSGIPLVVDDETEIKGDVTVGDLVKVEGRILADGTWLATEIKPVSMVWFGPGCLSISAVVVSLDSNQVELLNWGTIELDDSIIVEGEIAVDSVVLLIVCVGDDGTINIVTIIVIYYQPQPVIVILPTPLPPTRPPQPPPGDGDVTICHKPGTPAEQRKRVPWTALPSHLGHGDTIGSCE